MNHTELHIGDGAYGTLLAPHVRGGRDVTSLVLDEPARVVAAHLAYARAHARDVHTNTLLAYRRSDRARRDTYAAGIDCAREAVAAAGTVTQPLSVWFTIGPAGRDARDFWYDIEQALEAEVDGVRCATVPDNDTATAFLQAWGDVAAGVATPARLTLAPFGEHVADLPGWTMRLNVPDNTTIGLQCGPGPAPMRDALHEFAHAYERVSFVPSAGHMPPDGEPSSYDGPDAWAEAVIEAIDGLPIDLLGGCCGTTPAHVATLAELLGVSHTSV